MRHLLKMIRYSLFAKCGELATFNGAFSFFPEELFRQVGFCPYMFYGVD